MNNCYKQFVDRLLNCFACSFFFLIFSHFFTIDIQKTFLNFLFFSVFFFGIFFRYFVIVWNFVICFGFCLLSKIMLFVDRCRSLLSVECVHPTKTSRGLTLEFLARCLDGPDD